VDQVLSDRASLPVHFRSLCFSRSAAKARQFSTPTSASCWRLPRSGARTSKSVSIHRAVFRGGPSNSFGPERDFAPCSLAVARCTLAAQPSGHMKLDVAVGQRGDCPQAVQRLVSIAAKRFRSRHSCSAYLSGGTTLSRVYRGSANRKG